MGKGRTWCISFQSAATKAGDVKLKYKVKRSDGTIAELDGTWEGYTAGMTPDEKATRFFDRLRNDPAMSRLVNSRRAGNTVCFQLKDDAPGLDDILGIQVGDQTGQVIHAYDDLPEAAAPDEELLETVRFSLTGTPASREGSVTLGVGLLLPLVTVATFRQGRPDRLSRIAQALITAFNEAYEALGFQAEPGTDDGEVVIPKVPCKLGLRAGTDDAGLESTLGIADPEADPFCIPFGKPEINRAGLRILAARLDLAGVADVVFAGPELATFRQVPDRLFQLRDGGQEGDPFADTLAGLEAIRGLLDDLKKGKTDEQKKKLEQARDKIQEAIDGLKKIRDGDPDAPSEGEIEKALRDAADLIDGANPGRRNGSLRRAADNLRDIARNLF